MAKAKEAKASKSQNGGDAPTAPGSISEAPKDGEGPVLTIITKRLRAANKKLKRVEEIESSRAAGKTLNADQEEVLRGKAKVLGTIEELERLTPLLKEALQEEKSALETAAQGAAENTARAAAEQEAASKIGALEEAKAATERSAAAAQAEAEELKQQLAELQAAPSGEGVDSAVTRLLQLIYFAMLFPDDTSHQHQSERSACRSYDYDDEANPGAVLTADDLTLISQLGQLIIQRPPNQTLCHQDSLVHCKELAMKFLERSDELLLPLLNTSAAHVAERLDRVMSLGYISVVPQVVQVPTDIPVPQPNVSSGIIGNGMYAAHDEPIYTAPDVQPLNSAPLVTGFSSAPAEYKETQANYFPMTQDGVFAPLTDASRAPPADKAAHYPDVAAQAHQLNFMTESKVLESAPSFGHTDTAPAPVEPVAAPQASMPQMETANGYPVQQAPNGVPEPRSDRSAPGDRPMPGRGGRGTGQFRGGPPREARGGRGPPRSGRGGPPSGRGSGDLGTRGSGGEPFRGGRGGRGGNRGRGRGPPGAPQPTYAAV